MVYHVGSPAMLDGNMFLPDTGTPVNGPSPSAEDLLDRPAHICRAPHDRDARRREGGHFFRRRALPAGDDRAGVTHAPPRRRGLSGNETHHRFVELALDERCGI